MKKAHLPDIAKKAERFLLDIEQAVRGFARYHRYTVGTDLRTQAMAVVRLCNRAWRDRDHQPHWVSQLVWAIDELKLTLQLCSQLRAFRSFGQFEQLIRAADELGKCAGGWKRTIHLKGQNSAGKPPLGRAQILSGPAASTPMGANL